MLAVKVGLERYHQYIFGQQVQVETDHKPLIGLVQKAIRECTTHIQRMRLQMQQRDFILAFKSGKEFYLADALSRAPQRRLYTEEKSQGNEEQIHAIVWSIFATGETKTKYEKATAEDKTLQVVAGLVGSGWPQHKRSCLTPAQAFWNVRQDLTMAGSGAVVPTAGGVKADTSRTFRRSQVDSARKVVRVLAGIHCTDSRDSSGVQCLPGKPTGKSTFATLSSRSSGVSVRESGHGFA